MEILDLWIPLVRMENKEDRRLTLSIPSHPFPSQTLGSVRHSCDLASVLAEWEAGGEVRNAEETRQNRQGESEACARRIQLQATGSRGCAKQTFQTKRVENRTNYVEIGHSENVTEKTTVSAHVLTLFASRRAWRGVFGYVAEKGGWLSASVSMQEKKFWNSINVFLFGKKCPEGIF